MSIWLVVLLVAESIMSTGGQDWDTADRAPKRLVPSALISLPTAVRTELGRRGCTIPQPFRARCRPENVIKGYFTSPATDWAVLCSERVGHRSWCFAGSATDVADLASEPDLNSLQGIGNRAIGYSRALGVASAKYIRDHNVGLETRCAGGVLPFETCRTLRFVSHGEQSGLDNQSRLDRRPPPRAWNTTKPEAKAPARKAR
jgi:hypothetical protein